MRGSTCGYCDNNQVGFIIYVFTNLYRSFYFIMYQLHTQVAIQPKYELSPQNCVKEYIRKYKSGFIISRNPFILYSQSIKNASMWSTPAAVHKGYIQFLTNTIQLLKCFHSLVRNSFPVHITPILPHYRIMLPHSFLFHCFESVHFHLVPLYGQQNPF